MPATHEENVRHIHDWHQVVQCLPVLETILEDLIAEIDKEIIACDPGETDFPFRAVAAWAERRAVERVRKSLTKTIKRGRTASKTIAPSM